MYKLLIAACLVAAVAARPSLKAELTSLKPVSFELQTAPSGANDLCSVCVSFAEQAINQLLNIILNVGVVGSCGELCGILESKTGSKLLGTVCDLLCDVEGIQEFIKLIQKADLDPIYFCEELKQCKVNDNGDATITSFSSTPVSGPQGTEFEIDFTFSSKNGTGTGQLVFEIDTKDGIPLGAANLLPFSPPGTYSGKLTVNTQPDPDCDPTQQECEQWLSGLYPVKMAVCNGECGSKHPHSAIYDESQTNFTIA